MSNDFVMTDSSFAKLRTLAFIGGFGSVPHKEFYEYVWNPMTSASDMNNLMNSMNNVAGVAVEEFQLQLSKFVNGE